MYARVLWGVDQLDEVMALACVWCCMPVRFRLHESCIASKSMIQFDVCVSLSLSLPLPLSLPCLCLSVSVSLSLSLCVCVFVLIG